MKRILPAWGRSAKSMSAVGLVAALVLYLCVNVLCRRFYVRWDVTRAQLYSLSPVSVETLRAIDEPLEVIVLLAEGDPNTPSARQLLQAYAAQCQWLSARFIDPDKNPAELAAIQSRYGLAKGSLAADAAAGAGMVIVKGKSSWRIGAQELTSYDQDQGRVRPRLEQAITGGIRNVMDHKSRHVCFTRGHQEASIDSAGAEGLAAFRDSLERNNFEVSEADLGLLAKPADLGPCDVLVIAAPRIAIATAAATKLTQYLQEGGHVLLVLQPPLAEDGRIAANGLEGLLAVAGLKAQREVVFEAQPDLVLPLGLGGEIFLSTPKSHEITRLMSEAGEVRYRVLMQMPQSLALAEQSPALPLLVSSAKGRSIADPGRLADPDTLKSVLESGALGEHVLAAAAELDSTNGASQRQARLVVVGSMAPFQDTSLRDSGHYGSRLFVDSVMGWLGDQPVLVNIADKPGHEAGLSLTEEALTEVSRYVLLYMPITALLIGVIVLLRRRSTEKLSREPSRGQS